MIGRLYNWLFDRHRHEWETIESGEIYGMASGKLKGKQYVLRCKTCGDIQSRNCRV